MATTWKATTAYSVGHIVTPTTLGSYWFMCVKAGTSGGTEPSPWPVVKERRNTDGSVIWECHGPLGQARITYGTTDVTLPGEELNVQWAYGNPYMVLTKRGGSKAGPRSNVLYMGDEILQISGVLRGPGSVTDIANLRTIFKRVFKTNVMTLTLTGDWATQYGGSKTVMHSGSNAVRVARLKGAVHYNNVELQLITVDNS